MNSFSRFRRKRKDELLRGCLLLLTMPVRPILVILAVSSAAYANPYLAKPGERPVQLRIANLRRL